MLMRLQAMHAPKKKESQKEGASEEKAEAAPAAAATAPTSEPDGQAAGKADAEGEKGSEKAAAVTPAVAKGKPLVMVHDKEEAPSKAVPREKVESPSGHKPAMARATVSPTSGSGSKKKSTLLGRFFGTSGKSDAVQYLSGGSMLEENIEQHDDHWYSQQLARMGKDGVPCTKIATNGKPYERRILVDSRNLIVEVRGGRSGSTGILLDDLVDLRRGLSSPEFESLRIKKDITSPSEELSERALVLQTPHRTFSFLLPTPNHRSNLAYCILYLLKSKNRGVMATGSQQGASTPSTRAPKAGQGSVVYANRSTYEGQFQNYMRHGKGTLTLSDGTRYQSEWKNDERHGPGKEFCPDGTTFSGAYLNGLRHGHGTMTWPEGSKYSGQFERGRANGEGELLRTDGSVYRGRFHEDCMSGEGRMQWRDGVEYTGQFVGNRREGFGKMLWTSGKWKSYEGHWKDGMQHGSGMLCDHNGQEFRGYFKAGKLERWEEEAQHS